VNSLRFRALGLAAGLICLSTCARSPDLPAGQVKTPAPTSASPPTASVTSATPPTLVSVGESAYWGGNYDSARILWRKALGRARLEGNDTSEARILTWLGLTSWRKGDYPDARHEGEAALALKLRHHLDADLFKSFNALGLLAWNEGRLTDAATLFDKALLAARAQNDNEGIGKASGNLALVYGDMGEFGKASEGFVVMRDVGRALKDARIEGNALNNLGMIQIKLGEPGSAIPSLHEARRLYHSIDYGNGEQNALGQLGTAYDALGDHRAAFAALDSALALSRKQGLRQEEASNLEIIAELYREAGDIPRALRFFTDAQGIEKELGLAVQRAANLRNTAEIHATLGRVDVATALATEALQIHQVAKARGDEVRDLLFLGEVRGSNAGKIDYLAAADALIGRLHWKRAWIELTLVRARIADRDQRPRAVLRYLRATDGDLLRAGHSLEWEAHALRARSYARLGELDSAILSGRRAVASVERIRSTIGAGSLRNSYVADRERAYLDLVDALIRKGRIDEALEVSDAMRGRALEEHLLLRKGDTPGVRQSVVRSLSDRQVVLRRIDALAQRFEELDATAAAEHDSTAAATAKAIAVKLADAREQYETLVIRAEQVGQSRSVLGGGKAVASEIRKALVPGEALLEYLVTPERLIVFVVSTTGVRVAETALRVDDLRTRVRVTLGLLGTASSSNGASNAVLEDLHGELMTKAVLGAIPVGTRRLIIVPHSILSYVPFAALRNPVTKRYLIEDFDVVRLPSASALGGLRSTSHDAATAHAASLLAPFPSELPGTQREVQSAARSLAGAQTFIGQRADERSLREALGRGGVVHVATHGIMNARNPMFSRIELARGSSGESADDGRLEVHEVLELRVMSPLVFLSGCETGAGAAGSTPWSTGEDYATLAQAFLYAGTRDVIATLWTIQDNGASEFAGRFYRYLRTSSASDALALAQRETIRDAQFSSPYYWASYVISGEGLSKAKLQNGRVASVQLR
jgi:CHAT domain-containing protein/tetratricopeptide (TPR) repeat protein